MPAEILTKEDLEPLLAKLACIEERIGLIERSLPVREVYTIDDICLMLGISRNQARSRPWLLPNYGISEFPGKVKKWRVATYRTWMRIAPRARELDWHEMSAPKRRNIAAMAAGESTGDRGKRLRIVAGTTTG